MSRRAVREEVFVIFIHLSLVSFPSNPLNSLFRTFFCRSFGERFLFFKSCQNNSFSRALSEIRLDCSMARSRHPRNHVSHSVMSNDPAWAFFKNLRRHAVETLSTTVRSG